MHETQMRPVERRIGGGFAMRFGMRGGRLGVGRFKAETARHFDGAKDDLQHMQRTAGLEPIGMGRDAAHGVERDRAARHRLVMLAAEVGPCVLKLERFVKGDARQFGGDGADARRGDATALSHGFGRVLFTQILLGHLVKDRAVRDASRAVGGGKVGAHAGLVKGGEFAGLAVDHQRLAVLIAQLQAILRRLRVAVQ